jgi:Phosphotransferase enzyme family
VSTEFDPAPTCLGEVLKPNWLTTVLATRWPGVAVRDVRIVETIVTMATKVRLALSIDGGGEEVPTQLCIKGVLTDSGAVAASSIIETVFYRNAAAKVDVRVPACIHADLNAAGTNGVIVMKDVIAAGGTFCSALKPSTAKQAGDGLEQLALLHAAGWQGTTLYESPWIPRFLDRITATPILPLDTLQSLLDGPRGEPLPESIRGARRLQRGLEALAARTREGSNCLVHGDAHAGNVYRDAQGRLGVVDWQILQKGDWAQDVAYHVASVLSPEDRRTHERGLLTQYLDRLRSLGAPSIGGDEAWSRYRAAMVYGYYLWAITRKVEPEITLEFVRRLGLAVGDLDSFAVLGV